MRHLPSARTASVEQHPIIVVLPAPLGRGSRTPAARHEQSTPSTAMRAPKRLVTRSSGSRQMRSSNPHRVLTVTAASRPVSAGPSTGPEAKPGLRSGRSQWSTRWIRAPHLPRPDERRTKRFGARIAVDGVDLLVPRRLGVSVPRPHGAARRRYPDAARTDAVERWADAHARSPSGERAARCSASGQSSRIRAFTTNLSVART